MLDSIDQARKRVLDALTGKEYEAQKRNRYFEQFREIRDGAERCNNISTLRSFGDKADALKIRLLNEIAALDAEIARKKIQSAPAGGGSAVAVNTENIKVHVTKNIAIKKLTGAASWQLDSAADIDRVLSALREKLLEQLDENTTVNVEF